MAVSVPGGSIGATGTMRSSGLSDLLALLDNARPSWHQRAACRDSTVDFFTETKAGIDAARALCRSCPVTPQCAHYGADEPAGVWGGVAPAERGKGRRRAG